MPAFFTLYERRPHIGGHAAPSNKIFGFGGDLSIVEKVCGHLVMAKRNIAWALAEKIEDGFMSETEAIRLARKLLYDNPKSFYKLKLE